MCDAATLLHLSKSLNNIDTKLKKHALYALANVASHGKDHAEFVVEADVFPKVLIHMGHESPGVQKQGVRLVQEVVRHSPELAQLVVNAGGIGALLQLLLNQQFVTTDDDILIYAVTAIGFIAGQSEEFALAVIECNGICPLLQILRNEKASCDLLCSTIWTLGHMGKHTPEHSRAIGETGAYSTILELYLQYQNCDELQQKSKCTLKMCLQCCLYVPALEPLLYSAPSEILKYLVTLKSILRLILLP